MTDERKYWSMEKFLKKITTCVSKNYATNTDYVKLIPDIDSSASFDTWFNAASYWNESVKKLFETWGEFNKDSSKTSFTQKEIIDGVKNADAGFSFSSEPYVNPDLNADKQKYEEVRGDDKIESVLKNKKQMQYTHTQNKQDGDLTGKYIRLLMPKYLRRVEVEDLNRNFWVIAQTIGLISDYLLNPDGPLNQLLKGILNEIAQLWDNVYRLWETVGDLDKRVGDLEEININITKGTTKVGVIFYYEDGCNNLGIEYYYKNKEKYYKNPNSQGPYIPLTSVLVTEKNFSYYGFLPFVRTIGEGSFTGATSNDPVRCYYMPYNQFLTDDIICNKENESDGEREERLKKMFELKEYGGYPIAVDRRYSVQPYQSILKEIRGMNFVLVGACAGEFEPFEEIVRGSSDTLLSILQKIRNTLWRKVKKANFQDDMINKNINGTSLDYWSNCLKEMNFVLNLVADEPLMSTSYFCITSEEEKFIQKLSEQNTVAGNIKTILKEIKAVCKYIKRGSEYTNTEGGYYKWDIDTYFTVFNHFYNILNCFPYPERDYTEGNIVDAVKSTLPLEEAEHRAGVAAEKYRDEFKSLYNFESYEFNGEIVIINPKYLTPEGKIEKSEWDWDLLSAKYRGDTFQNFDNKYRVEKVKNSNIETDSEFSLLEANMDDGSVRLDEATYNNLKTKEGRTEIDDKTVAPGIIWYEGSKPANDNEYKQSMRVLGNLALSRLGCLYVGSKNRGCGCDYLYPSTKEYSCTNLFGYWLQFHKYAFNTPKGIDMNIRSAYFNEYSANRCSNKHYKGMPGNLFTLTSYNLDITLPIVLNENSEYNSYQDLIHFGEIYPSIIKVAETRTNNNNGNISLTHKLVPSLRRCLEEGITTEKDNGELVKKKNEKYAPYNYMHIRGQSYMSSDSRNLRGEFIDGFYGITSAIDLPHSDNETQKYQFSFSGGFFKQNDATDLKGNYIGVNLKHAMLLNPNRKDDTNWANQSYFGPTYNAARAYGIITSDLVNKNNIYSDCRNQAKIPLNKNGDCEIVFNISFIDSGTTYQSVILETEKDRTGTEHNVPSYQVDHK